MCGIFGLVIKKEGEVKPDFISSALNYIAGVSIARGQDSSGIVFKREKINTLSVLKGDIPVTQLLKTKEYNSLLNVSLDEYSSGNGFQAMGHARLVTNGSQLKAVNNQPVVKDGVVAIHNGIISNDKELWNRNPDLKREYDIDTEIFLSLIKKDLKKGTGLHDAIKINLGLVEGTVSASLFFDDRDEIALCTNNGSLFYALSENMLLFASEEYFIKQTLEKFNLDLEVVQLKPFDITVIDSGRWEITEGSRFQRDGYRDQSSKEEAGVSRYKMEIQNLKSHLNEELVIDPMEYIDRSKEKDLFDLLEDNSESIKKLKRCTKCILPETFPFIDFDEKGTCNYCRNYVPKKQAQDFSQLKKLVEKYKRKDGRPDCLVPFSGGRDSTYTLHIVKKELGLNPIAFTYDWGMVTDLARRNIARVCGKLGVENIIVSADIKWKRENIRKNIEAWLRRPELGMIPLFMAGDKYFFYYCNEVKKRTSISLNIWGINNLENTNFKTGFAGLRPQFNKKRIYSISLANQLKLFAYVGKNMLLNPSYINQSLLDTLGSFAVRYISPKKDYYHLFDYYQWNEKELEELIDKEYKWEKAIDTKSTWRIGDGTATFYNYIYYTVAGFTENDTFRSNQIRDGQISREEAIEKIYEENKARYETMRWYLAIIGVDFKKAISTINTIPKLYRVIG